MISKHRKYWESLSDDELIKTEMITDDPQRLPDLVTVIPEGHEEAFVELKYDLRKSGREPFHCVHGNHSHLAGFVMRKGPARFLVGWMCGKTVYGEDFDQLTADFETAVMRRDTLRRALDIKNAVDPFQTWLKDVFQSDIFARFESVRDQMYEHLPWIFENLERLTLSDVRLRQLNAPRNLFKEGNDPEVDWAKAMADFDLLTLRITSRDDWAEQNIANMKRSMEGLLRRFEEVIAKLKEVETFFQPGVLAILCEFANAYDNPKKRQYAPGILSIKCKRGRDPVVVCMPRQYETPSLKPIQAFRATVSGLPLSNSKAA